MQPLNWWTVGSKFVLDHALSFESHLDATVKKIQQQLHVLRRLKVFNVSCEMMNVFLNKGLIESVLLFCIIAWFGDQTW